MKIELPDWVYSALKRYGNVALPNNCNEMDRTELKKVIEKKVGSKVVIRETQLMDCGNDMRNKLKFKPFLTVETEK